MTQKIDYTTPKVYRSRFWMWVPRPTLPAKLTATLSLLSLMLLVPALWMMHDFRFIRDYNPHWWQWVTPIAVPLAIICAIIGLVPSKQGYRRRTLWIASLGLILSSAAAAYAVLMPGAVVDGERADRIRCAMNLRTIGQGLAAYASANGGNYPDDLATLITTSTIGISPDCLVCSMSNDDVAYGKNLAAQIRKGGHCSYTYLGKGLNSTQRSTVILAYETSTQNHDGMINILYGDGHVELDSANVVTQALAKATTQPAH